MRKLTIGLAGVFALLLIALSASAGGTFSDDDGSVHEGYIEALAASGITKGCSPTEFCPTEEVTRGQMAAFLNRSLNLPKGSEGFSDSIGHVFEADIRALAASGITRGCNPPTNNRFCPDRSVTRGEMAAFLVRAFGYERSSVDSFVDDDGSDFETDIQALAAAGITKGCSSTMFCPNDPVTRGQMASFLGRALGLTPTVSTPPTTPPTTTPPTTEFEAFTVSGSGNDVIALSVPGDKVAVVKATHDGSSNFIVWSLEGDLTKIDLLVNEIGAYQGVVGLNIGWFSFSGKDPVRHLEVKADGNWSFTISPLSAARSMGTSRAGQGDEILRYTVGTPNVLHSTHDGSSNFIVVGHEQDGSYGGLIVNEIGPYNGNDVVDAGVRILEIRADGHWTMES